MNKKPWFVAMFVLSLLFSSCNISQGDDQPYKIGFCLDTLVLERWTKDRDVFVAEATRLGAQAVVRNANGDGDLQKRQVRELIEQNVAVIVIIPIDSQGFTELVEQAKRKGIAVVAYDRLLGNAGADCFVSFDTENIGPYMLDTLAKKQPQGNFVILGGSTLDENTLVISKGIKERIKQHPNIYLEAEIYSENWSASAAFEKISQLLEQNVQVDGVLCGNDALAVGAIRALSEYQLAGKVPVSGQDADLESCQRIVEGTQTMTVYKPIAQLAKLAAQLSVRLAQGETLGGEELFFDGKYEVPRYNIPVQIVTAENMYESVIADGFQELEHVYRNVPQEMWPVQP